MDVYNGSNPPPLNALSEERASEELEKGVNNDSIDSFLQKIKEKEKLTPFDPFLGTIEEP